MRRAPWRLAPPARGAGLGAAALRGAAGIAPPAAATPALTVVEDDAHPLRPAALPPGALEALLRLRAAGHVALLAGGAVRDLLLGRPAKDIDVLTSAALRDVRALFPRAPALGGRHPIVQAEVAGVRIDISSLATSAPAGTLPADAAALLGAHKQPQHVHNQHHNQHCQAQQAQHQQQHGRAPGAPPPDGVSWAAARRANAAARDFTVNSLLWDPLGSNSLYDYVGGLPDVRARLLRACGDPDASFTCDPARVLRGVRGAARAGLAIEPRTEAAMRRAAPAVAGLPAARLRLEAECLLLYGAAAASLALLHRLQLLHVLLPAHAALLAGSTGGSSSAQHQQQLEAAPLFRALAALDARASPQQPAPPEAAAALLAAPLVQARLRALRQQLDHQAQQQQAAQQGSRRRQQQWSSEEEEADEAAVAAATPSATAAAAAAVGAAPTAARGPVQQWQQRQRWSDLLPPAVAAFAGRQQALHTAQQPGRAPRAAAGGGGRRAEERAQVHAAVWDVAEELSSGSAIAGRHLHHAAALLLKHWHLCRLRRGPLAAEDSQEQQRAASDDAQAAVSSSGHGDGSSSAERKAAQEQPAACPRLLRHLLQRRDELLSLRAARRARAAADGISRGAGKAHALTKVERGELREVRLRLKALGWRGEEPVDASSGGGGERGRGGAGAVMIGLCKLADVERREADAAGGGGGGRAGGRSRESLAGAVAALTAGELLVHECLLAAGIAFDELAC